MIAAMMQLAGLIVTLGMTSRAAAVEVAIDAGGRIKMIEKASSLIRGADTAGDADDSKAQESTASGLNSTATTKCGPAGGTCSQVVIWDKENLVGNQFSVGVGTHGNVHLWKRGSRRRDMNWGDDVRSMTMHGHCKVTFYEHAGPKDPIYTIYGTDSNLRRRHGTSAISVAHTHCKTDCVWDTWNAGACSATCGYGTMRRTRSKKVQEQHGGRPCSGVAEDTPVCPNLPPCDCVWEDWDAWDACSATCGPGSKKRRRVLRTAGGGKTCPAQEEESEECTLTTCPTTTSSSTTSTPTTTNTTTTTDTTTTTLIAIPLKSSSFPKSWRVGAAFAVLLHFLARLGCN
eukprot:gb/GFBE01069878.1/.p1 GENE.gb/GFBE01069878.1/~~gb/GFBE01069878.1/.p1  ORF type:complete len:344 (+),score=34.25 gb/GFBE01069878.1/:1-1032(+)